MIVFDIEWNHGCDESPLDEILQIGAVRLDRLGGRILDTFNVYIHPSVHSELGVMAREVLELELFQRSKLDFAAAYRAFLDWCGEETVYATWGSSDMDVLRLNCEYWKLPGPEFEEVYDIQATFSARLGTKQRIALYRAVDYCAIPDCIDCHNALHDAVYTAVIGEWLSQETLIPCALPRRLQRLSQEKFPLQPRRRVGPFHSVEAALNSRDNRLVSCPHCGEKAWIQCWNYSVPRKYYADFNCPRHGWFVCRLSLTPMEDGTWRGRVAVPAPGPRLLQEFRAATKANCYVCKRISRKRRRRRTKQSKTIG